MLIDKRNFLTWIWHSRAIRFSFSHIYLDAFDQKGHFGYKRKAFTLQTKELDADSDKLFEQCSNTVRNEIRRAERLNCTYQTSQDSQQFLPILNATAQAKHLIKKTAKTFANKPNSIFTSSLLNGSIAACHYYLIDKEEKIANLLFSGSARYLSIDEYERKNITFSHRYLLFKDMLMLKGQGIQVIKLGKLNLDSDGNPIGASNFRSGFNCTIQKSYNYYPWGYYIFNEIREKLKILRSA